MNDFFEFLLTVVKKTITALLVYALGSVLIMIIAMSVVIGKFPPPMAQVKERLEKLKKSYSDIESVQQKLTALSEAGALDLPKAPEVNLEHELEMKRMQSEINLLRLELGQTRQELQLLLKSLPTAPKTVPK